MVKKSVKTLWLISLIFTAASSLLGIIYILSSETINGYFVGDYQGLIDGSPLPNWLAFLTLCIAVIGLCIFSVGGILVMKGKSKQEKQNEGKKYSLFASSLCLSLLVWLLGLLFIVPSEDREPVKNWVPIVIMIAAGGLTVSAGVGYCRFINNSKKDIITSKSKKRESDDF